MRVGLKLFGHFEDAGGGVGGVGGTFLRTSQGVKGVNLTLTTYDFALDNLRQFGEEFSNSFDKYFHHTQTRCVNSVTSTSCVVVQHLKIENRL